ncbi:hypothetical protein LOZ57_006869 [Ophidiomyces ophidiicola]|uniref:uncharacterized protein n=1 Tax=Ophidiomyces ophidiicola TaxID=1387563 RepID=UPI0020C233D4|nr:uncharacterized protein LOZ57_006869 [Ophidiomyces ophidiicola]KAI1935839.1 hypothetical protein LOZ57_006869 [Ophidiomyces ophidiicola]KAI2043940.1 hypothetical protein LOZ43_006511 [Ophidiomyces ophidiicola]
MHAEQQITLLVNSDSQALFIESDSQLPFFNSDFQLPFTEPDSQLSFTESDSQVIECTSVDICIFRDLIDNEEHSITASTASDQSDTESEPEDVVIQDILKKILHDMRESSDSINLISQSETSFKHISMCQNEAVENQKTKFNMIKTSVSVSEDADQFMIVLSL